MRVALLDPDLQQRKMLESLLESARHQCTGFARAEALLSHLQTAEPDLLVIHWQTDDDLLPGLSAIRRHSALPLLLIAARAPGEDVLRLLADGPADFILKPLRRAELQMRVQLLMQRYRPGRLEEETEVFGPYVFMPRSARLRLDNRAIALTQKEFELALLFFRNLGRPLSRAYIHESVWSQDAELSSRTLDTHVSRVRAKLGLRPEKGLRLAPVYSFGYRLEQIGD